MRHPSSPELSHSQFACENVVDCAWTCCKLVTQDTHREDRLFSEKRRYAPPQSHSDVAPVWIRYQGKSYLVESDPPERFTAVRLRAASPSTRASSRWTALDLCPCNKGKLHHPSLFIFLHSGPLHVRLTFDEMIDGERCGFNQLRVIHPCHG
jgi:hypothetical protein